jgi:hypothetical protein
MKHILYLFVLLLVFLQGCSALPAAQPATSAPAPTETSAPTTTSTPLPTDTPTPVPTSTPDKTATAAAQSTVAAKTVLGELDQLLGDTDIPYQDGHLEWQQGKPLMVTLKGPGWDYVEVDEDLIGKNFILKSDVTWEASGLIMCNAIFRSEPDLEKGEQYKFSYLRLSGLPAWEIGVYENGRFKNSFTKTHFSDAIDLDNRATNQVLIIAQDEQITLYINGVRQGRYYDYSRQRMEGVFGFSANQDSGEGSCNFENSWVWALE